MKVVGYVRSWRRESCVNAQPAALRRPTRHDHRCIGGARKKNRILFERRSNTKLTHRADTPAPPALMRQVISFRDRNIRCTAAVPSSASARNKCTSRYRTIELRERSVPPLEPASRQAGKCASAAQRSVERGRVYECVHFLYFATKRDEHRARPARSAGAAFHTDHQSSGMNFSSGDWS